MTIRPAHPAELEVIRLRQEEESKKLRAKGFESRLEKYERELRERIAATPAELEAVDALLLEESKKLRAKGAESRHEESKKP